MIYLDNAATSFPKPESVYQALDQFARTSLANPGRAGHKMALAAERMLDDGRHLLNQFLNGEGPERVIFTYNCTDGLNLAIKGVLQKGDHVITSDLEHNSISRPLVAMEKSEFITLTRVAADAGGTLDPAAIQRAITPKTKLVVLTQASNVLGTVQPVAAIGKVVRDAGKLFLVDAAQAAGVIPIDVRAMNIDMVAFPGHKGLFGPTGTGVLYVGPRAQPHAWREGGTGGDSSSPTQPRELPYFLEGGTPNVLGVAGLVAGLKWVTEKGMDKIHHQEMELLERLRRRLKEIPGLRLLGHDDLNRRVAAQSFVHEGLAAAEIGGILDSAFEIGVRPGLHCAPYIHKAQGTFPAGAVRVSPGPFTTPEEIDRCADALKDILSGF